MSCSVNELKSEIVRVLKSDYGYDAADATVRQAYGAVLRVVQQRLLDKRGRYQDHLKQQQKPN